MAARNSIRLMHCASQGINSEQPTLSDERFETANGDTCCLIFQTIHFPGVQSLQQVYNSLLFSLDNAEISLSERLGNVTVRDDYGDIDGNTFHARIVSTNDDGVATELNCIMMSQLLGGGACGEHPRGIITIDSVDRDDLYPYKPKERIRKDVFAAFVLADDSTPTTQGKTVITLRRAVYIKLHCPEFELSESVWQEQQFETTRWGDVLIKSMRSILYATP
ncbi:unnamed protein product [Phytophthora fragariaefolia]|uniref:Unnamed protein product n=1 Tax=Phytophthora fragariaefolia TaxID=1490495 RepID=A0A9W6U4H1_9STRA|nr:unnamed protein product [Phytophthora fragariaefolia]